MVRMSDIAEKTGLNISTVSRALSGSCDISEATRNMVLQMADKLGYTTREHRNFARKTILIIVPELLSQYYSEMIHTLKSELSIKGYKVITAIGGYGEEEICATLNDVKSFEVSGMFLVFSGLINSNMANIYSKMPNIPTVLLSELGTTIPLDTIFISQRCIMELAVAHLKDLGHRAIGYVGEYFSNCRLAELKSICKETGLELLDQSIFVGSERFENGGYLRMKEMIASENLPTAVISSYDQIAIGAMRAALEANLRIPRDISFIGIDDIAAGAYLPIPLTSIMTPVTQMCTIAVKLLHDLIENPREHIVQHVSLQSKLVIRDSTARLRT